jgi:CheY-like chemotaxis protein
MLEIIMIRDSRAYSFCNRHSGVQGIVSGPLNSYRRIKTQRDSKGHSNGWPRLTVQLTLKPSTLEERRLVRFLVVDDNPAVRHYLRALLEQQNNWQVCSEARSGKEALQRVEMNPPDMILLDFQMPDLNGLDVARQISRLFPAIPILMITIHLSKQLAEEARRVGIRGACAKSDVGSIVEAVDVLLHKGTYFPTVSSVDN